MALERTSYDAGRTIRVYRVARRWRQADLAAAAGVSRATVCRIERGATKPCRATARVIAAALDATVDELFGPLYGGDNGDRGAGRPT